MQTIHTIREIIEESVQNYSQNTAFRIKEKSEKGIEYKDITYREFGSDIRTLGTYLLEKDLKRIAVIGENSYLWSMCYYATVCSGGISIPLDKGLLQEEIENFLSQSSAEIIFFGKTHYYIMSQIAAKPEFSSLKFVYMDKRAWDDNLALAEGETRICREVSNPRGFARFESLSEYVRCGIEMLSRGSHIYDDTKTRGDDLVNILFTSGTTSSSKAVMLTNDNIAANIYALKKHIEFRESDVNMAFLPFHHTFGNVAVLLLLANGATNVFCDGLKYVQQNLKEYEVSVFIAVPLLLEGIYNKVIKEVKKQGKYEKLKKGVVLSGILAKFGIDVRKKMFKEIHEKFGGKIRLIISGASALNPDVGRAYNAIGITLLQGYGLTETSPVVSGECVGRIRKGSVGIPMCNLEVKIENKGADGIGEIVVRGPSVMKGYYNNPEETAKVLKNGWFYTGDLGYMEEDGQLYIKGRKKNVIVLKNGKNIYPEEIEETLSKIDFATESLVYAMEKGEDFVICAKLIYDKEKLKKAYPELASDIENKKQGRIEEVFWEKINEINDRVPLYRRIKRIVVSDIPMEKTTTAKIKRYKEIQNA